MNRLAPFLQISVQQFPGNDTIATYETQAAQVESTYGGLPGNTIVIGHSNGGVVAREWSRLRPNAVGAVITLGTPHQGEPLFDPINWVDMFHFHAAMVRDGVRLFDEFYFCWSCPAWGYDFTWSTILDDLVAVGLQDTIDALFTVIGFESYEIMSAVSPVVPEMSPNSTFLQFLNSPQNLSREAAQIPTRIAIVSDAYHWWIGGVFRARAPDDADWIASVRDVVHDALWYYYDYIQMIADANVDWHAMALLPRIANFASDLGLMDLIWCMDVSFPASSTPPAGHFFGQCAPHDGEVPAWTAAWELIEPGVQPITILGGPAHGQETRESADVLAFALTQFAGIQPNFGPTALPGPDRLLPCQAMLPDHPLISQNGRFQLLYQLDGNLVLYDNNTGMPWWASNTVGTSPGQVIMQCDGNLVIYDGDNVPVWSSGTVGQEGAWLLLDNYAQAIIYNANLVPLWINWGH